MKISCMQNGLFSKTIVWINRRRLFSKFLTSCSLFIHSESLASVLDLPCIYNYIKFKMLFFSKLFHFELDFRFRILSEISISNMVDFYKILIGLCFIHILNSRSARVRFLFAS